MALPKIDAPTFEITLPISKKTIKFRPFLVKEQKILLMAMESKEKDVIENNIEQILQNCAITEVDVSTLPLIDIEYYFLHLRARSVGEVIESKYKCQHEVGGEVCGNSMDVSINVLDINVQMPTKAEDTIMLTESVGIKMKYPDFSVVEKLQEIPNATDMAFELVLNCIDYIFDGDNLYYTHETPRQEMMEFLESLTKDQFAKLEEFIEDLPKLNKNVDITCSKCGFVHHIEVQGLDNFFG